MSRNAERAGMCHTWLLPTQVSYSFNPSSANGNQGSRREGGKGRRKGKEGRKAKTGREVKKMEEGKKGKTEKI